MDEKTPLISAEAQPQPSRPLVEPVWANSDNPQATINCQVCNHVVSFQNRQKQLVVRCPNCSEATPIRGPPAGKQYVRCPCNCLLICSATTTRVGCPRPDCQKVIILCENDNGSAARVEPNAARSRMQGGTFGHPNSLRVACGNCNSLFSVAGNPAQDGSRQSALISCLSGGTSAGAAGLIAARCPHCRKVTSVGPAYARVRLVIYGLLALISLLIAVGVTLGTLQAAKEKKALYFLWSVLYLIFVVLSLRAAVFFFMPISSVEVPVFQI